MKWIIQILFCVLLVSCKEEYEYGRLSYQTHDSTLLPIIVKVNGYFVDSITRISDEDCTHTPEYTILISDNTYELTIYGTGYDSTKHVYINVNDCKLLNIKR